MLTFLVFCIFLVVCGPAILVLCVAILWILATIAIMPFYPFVMLFDWLKGAKK